MEQRRTCARCGRRTSRWHLVWFTDRKAASSLMGRAQQWGVAREREQFRQQAQWPVCDEECA